jgi:hypothetical protein
MGVTKEEVEKGCTMKEEQRKKKRRGMDEEKVKKEIKKRGKDK